MRATQRMTPSSSPAHCPATLAHSFLPFPGPQRVDREQRAAERAMLARGLTASNLGSVSFLRDDDNASIASHASSAISQGAKEASN